jgi:hypothetical protein
MLEVLILDYKLKEKIKFYSLKNYTGGILQSII